MKILIRLLLVCIGILTLSYLVLVIPRDERIAMPQADVAMLEHREKRVFDFTKKLSTARVKSPGYAHCLGLLQEYPYKQMHPALHAHPMNLHLSLGWFPLKTDHKDCIFAPGNTDISYEMTLPEKPVLKFDYGIVSSINKEMCDPVLFKVLLVDEKNKEHEVFSAMEFPLYPFRWGNNDWYYKNVHKYLYPDIENREGMWGFARIDLAAYQRQKVQIRFLTERIDLNAESFDVAGIQQSCAINKSDCENRCYDKPYRSSDSPLDKKSGAALAFWSRPAVYDRGKAGQWKNVLFIVVDSVRADHLNKRYMPNLWAYAEKSMYCTNALSNGNATKLSVPSFLLSKNPHEITEISMHYTVTQKQKEAFYARQLPSLASVLKDNGYATALIGSASLFSDGHGFSADMGFDEVINLEHSGYSPPHVTKTALEWLAKHGQEKHFLVLYYDGPHGPYRPPLAYMLKSVMRGGLFRNMREILYTGEILYHDRYIEYLQKYLKSSGFADDTLVVFTSDHGVTFRAVAYDWPAMYGAWKKKKVSFHSHGVSLTPDDIRVPLFIYDRKTVKTIMSRVPLLDLAPTIVDMLGITPPKSFQGMSLKPYITGNKEPDPSRVSFHLGWQNYGIYWDSWLFIKNYKPREGFPPESVVPEELYDLSRDPLCQKNLAYVFPYVDTVSKDARKRMDMFVPSDNAFARRENAQGASGQLKSMLEQWGYINQ